jgi:hypothetical protein
MLGYTNILPDRGDSAKAIQKKESEKVKIELLERIVFYRE